MPRSMSTVVSVRLLKVAAIFVAVLAEAQTPTDPKSLVSAKMPEFAPATTAQISDIDQISFATWPPDGKSVAYTSTTAHVCGSDRGACPDDCRRQ